MSKLYYPAIFHREDNGGYSVNFPDLLGCVTEGDTLEEAVRMAEDAAGLYLWTLKEDKEPAPQSSDPSSIQPEKGDFVSLIEWDEAAYLRRTDTHSVKKTVTIPSWLDILGRERNINFSNMLQNALIRELGVAK